MKNLNWLLLCVLFALCVSCSKEDDNPCDGLNVPNGYLCQNGNIIEDPNGFCLRNVCGEGFSCDENLDECVPTSSEVVVVTGILSENAEWTADKIYELGSKVVVSSGVTLKIQAGTIIKGRAGSGSLATALIVARGGRIEAMGSVDAPIVFTSVQDNIQIGQKAGSNLDETQAGLWGGLIILGSAPISAKSGAEAQIEGIPGDETYGLYGGTETADDSGVINYVSIRHGGALIGEGNEINGLTLGGVGNGTLIENVEVVGNLDDGIECFGGTVDIKNALVWAQGDDAYDVDQSYAGTIDNFIYIAGDNGDHGLEIDGPESAVNPDGKFILKNGTLKGSALKGEFADFRDGAQGNVENVYFYNFEENADLELDDDKTSSNYFAGDLILKGLEFNAPGKTIADICGDKSANGNDAGFDIQMATENAVVTSPTVGAQTSVFAWTLAHEKGALNF